MEDNSVVCIHLLNGETIICSITNMNENWISVSQPYSFSLNIMDNKTINFVPYLSEFTNDSVFDINTNMIVSIFNPHEKYKLKYIEFTSENKKQQLLNE